MLEHDGGSRGVSAGNPAGAACSAAARARPPQKRPSFGVRTPGQLDLCFITFRRDRAMGLFLVFFWCAAIARAVLRYNSRLGGFNSRLGPNKFPFGPLRELAGKGLICLAVFATRTALMGNNRKNSRLHGNNQEFRPRRTGRRHNLQWRRSALPAADRLVRCQPRETPCERRGASHPTKRAARYPHRLAAVTPSPLLYYLNAPEH